METENIQSTLGYHQRWEIDHYTLEQCQEAITLINERIRRITSPTYIECMSVEVIDLELTVRPCNALINAGLKTVGDIINFGLDNLRMLRSCGPVCCKEIREAVLKSMPENIYQEITGGADYSQGQRSSW